MNVDTLHGDEIRFYTREEQEMVSIQRIKYFPYAEDCREQFYEMLVNVAKWMKFSETSGYQQKLWHLKVPEVFDFVF